MSKSAEAIRGSRKIIGLTQEEVAFQLRVSAKTVARWEAGECLPSNKHWYAYIDLIRDQELIKAIIGIREPRTYGRPFLKGHRRGR